MTTHIRFLFLPIHTGPELNLLIDLNSNIFWLQNEVRRTQAASLATAFVAKFINHFVIPLFGC